MGCFCFIPNVSTLRSSICLVTRSTSLELTDLPDLFSTSPKSLLFEIGPDNLIVGAGIRGCDP